MRPLPIGIQDFGSLISRDYLYVDKTEHYYNVFKEGKYYFLSRPRRFGKSLMLSTLKYLYLGKKELFKGLWIENKWDWEKVYPVIHVDLSKVDTKNSTLQYGLMSQMKEHAERFGIELEGVSAADCFRELIYALGQGDLKLVVLIDEYDKPITDYITEPEISKKHIGELKAFYGQLKSSDPYLHKVVITGVSKYGKVSIFSDLNNLTDLTISPDCSMICGYTQPELEHYFRPYFKKPMQSYGLSEIELLSWLKIWYNGYSWNGVESESVYNPFSVLNFFYHARFNNYWFETGTPTFLTELMKINKIRPETLEMLTTTETIFSTSDLYNLDVLSLLTQTGYLTVKKVILNPAQTRFILAYPNKEVRLSFSNFILAEYTGKTAPSVETDIVIKIQDALTERNWDQFFELSNAVFATVPYSIFNNNEAYYHSLVHVLLTLTGHLVLSEVMTNKGRIDTVLETEEMVVVFEYKIDSSPELALAQIHEKKYAERYSNAKKELISIGVNFDTEKRRITGWVVE
jgi:hypothetical protein